MSVPSLLLPRHPAATPPLTVAGWEERGGIRMAALLRRRSYSYRRGGVVGTAESVSVRCPKMQQNGIFYAATQRSGHGARRLLPLGQWGQFAGHLGCGVRFGTEAPLSIDTPIMLLFTTSPRAQLKNAARPALQRLRAQTPSPQRALL